MSLSQLYVRAPRKGRSEPSFFLNQLEQGFLLLAGEHLRLLKEDGTQGQVIQNTSTNATCQLNTFQWLLVSLGTKF